MRRPSTSATAKPWFARKCRANEQKLAHEDAERRQSGDGNDAEDESPAEQGVAFCEPADVGEPLRALHLRDMPDREEDRRLGQAVHGHVQEAGEVGEWAAHAERERHDAHVLDRGVGEEAFDVAPAVEHEGGEDERHETERDHQGPGCDRRGVRRKQDLVA